MNPISALFPENYEASRARFRSNLAHIQERWPDAQLSQHALPGDEDLTIDWIQSPATQRNEKVFILTTGEHGIEGYVGSAMQQRFIEHYLPRLDPATTGLLFVHAINPWGMKYHRRVNVNNVDLNRNFVWGTQGFSTAINPEYDQVNSFLNPTEKIGNLKIGNLKFYAGLLVLLAKMNISGFRHATLLGQYRYPQGLYYGGSDYQEETRTLIDLYRGAMEQYEQILHLDMHTGYGPRYQMSLVNSVHEKGSSAQFVERFNYPLVVAANPNEFYAIQGDMVDYLYDLWQREFSEKRLYSTTFEFGTLGDSIFGIVHSPRAMILENQLCWHKAESDSLRSQVVHEFEELFNPAADDWHAKAVADADQAFDGILEAEGYL